MLLPIVETLIASSAGETKFVRCIRLQSGSGVVFLKPLDELHVGALSSMNESIVMALWRDDPVLTQDTGEFFETAPLCDNQQVALQKFMEVRVPANQT